MQAPRPGHMNFEVLQSDLKKGSVKVPQFQREFVWERHRSAKLLDSILKNYPLGTFILWKTKERLRAVRDIGGMQLPPAPDGDYVMQVLDGQQRMTSLFAALEGVTIGNKNFGEICVDLNADPDGDNTLVYESVEEAPEVATTIRFRDLRNQKITELVKLYDETKLANIDTYKQRIQSYLFPTVEINDAPLAVATEIFSRLNVGGKSLSVYEIMVAKTWDDSDGFDLNYKVEELNKILKSNFGEIDPTIIMQNNVAMLLASIKAIDILNMDKKKFIQNWRASSEALQHAVDFCRSSLGIPVRALLPYQRILIPLSYYFYKTKQDPVGDARRRLIDLFYRIGLSERYSGSTETKMGQDLKNIDKIIINEPCELDFGVDTSSDFIMRNGNFRAGKAYIKTILGILAAQKPKDFRTHGDVILDNAMLKQKNSRNYHHFFPIAQFKKNIKSDFESNHIGNITLIGGDLNKNKIRSKLPSEYIGEFKSDNPCIYEDLKSHLIDIEDMKVLEDNYDLFLAKRCQAISRALHERIIPHAMDAHAPRSLKVDEDVEIERTDLDDSDETEETAS